VRSAPRRPASLERAARDLAVIELVAAGMTDAAIGRELGLGHRTVRDIVRRQRLLVGAESRTALASSWLLSPACTPEHWRRLRARLERSRRVSVA
jgi:DNA-binding NarL/FixJ family response regulator